MALGNETLPVQVEGTEDVCFTASPGAPPLPFGHHAAFSSGLPKVDVMVAERLAPLEGVPVARLMKVTRRIDRGETVSSTSALILSDVQQTTVAADRLEVPKDYRYQEPELTAPARRRD